MQIIMLFIAFGVLLFSIMFGSYYIGVKDGKELSKLPQQQNQEIKAEEKDLSSEYLSIITALGAELDSCTKNLEAARICCKDSLIEKDQKQYKNKNKK